MKDLEFSELKTITAKVKFLLERNPLLREDDSQLVAVYYFHEVGKDAINTMSALEFVTLLSKSKLPLFQSICRKRQELQQHNESLRGEQYKNRKKKVSNWFKVSKEE